MRSASFLQDADSVARYKDHRPGRRVRDALASFTRDAQGAAAVEFAFVAVPFFGFVLLIMQVGLYHFSLQSLDFATRQAGRKIMTGSVSTTITSAEAFKTQLICPGVFWAIRCSDVVVNAHRVIKASDPASSSGVYALVDAQKKALKPSQTDPAKQTFCLGSPGDYVFLDVSYPYANYVGKLLSSSASSTWAMRSTTFVFNEPFKTASATGSC